LAAFGLPAQKRMAQWAFL